MRIAPRNPRVYRLSVDNAPGRVWVDRRFAARLNRYNWKWVPAAKRARALLSRKGRREFLHRFIANDLAGKGWEEIFFADQDPMNCLLSNLRSYEREEQGATRRRYRNNTTGRKGVYFKKSVGKWYAVIRARKKLLHLGYFSDADGAARAYAQAFKLKHPKLKLK